MKRLAYALAIAFLAAAPAAAVKYVAVVESDIDAASGAAAGITPAEVRLITAELRREAVKNLPSDQYNVMTSETVMAQGSAKLEECAEENCVIALGAKIGADFIVRGIISKFQTLFTLTVDIFETDDGNLVASSDPIRSENIRVLLENAAPICASMYKDFVNAQSSRKTAGARAAYTVTAVASPANGGYVTRSPDKAAYSAGEPLTLTATAYDGYTFTGWSGASNSVKAVLTAPVDRDLELTANFQPARRTYSLSLKASPPDGGSVTANPDKKAYDPGEKVDITAAPKRGYAFEAWSGGGGCRKPSDGLHGPGHGADGGFL